MGLNSIGNNITISFNNIIPPDLTNLPPATTQLLQQLVSSFDGTNSQNVDQAGNSRLPNAFPFMGRRLLKAEAMGFLLGLGTAAMMKGLQGNVAPRPLENGTSLTMPPLSWRAANMSSEIDALKSQLQDFERQGLISPTAASNAQSQIAAMEQELQAIKNGQNPAYQSPAYQSPAYQSPAYQSPAYQSPVNAYGPSYDASAIGTSSTSTAATSGNGLFDDVHSATGGTALSDTQQQMLTEAKNNGVDSKQLAYMQLQMKMENMKAAFDCFSNISKLLSGMSETAAQNMRA